MRIILLINFCLFFLLNLPVISAQDSLLNINTRNYDQKHIKLNLKFDFDEAKVFGEAEFTFSVQKENLNSIILHAKTMSVTSIKNGGNDLKFRQDDDYLYINLEKNYNKNDEITLFIEYMALPSRGMYFFKPTKEIPEIPYQIWTQGQADYNRHWYPAYDLPDDKLTSEIIATVPSDLIAVGNGVLLSEIINDDKTKTFHWKMDKVHSSYLITLIVGDYKTVKENFKGTVLEYNLPPDWEKDWDYSYGRTPQMMEYFSSYIAPYPYERYAQTTVQDFEWGGMENVTSTTLNRRIHHDTRAIPNYSADGLIAHELVHQWFGDYLTCKTWDHIWLNEGITTYFTDMWTENEKGHDEFLHQRREQNKSYFEALKTEPLEKIILNPNKIPVELGGGKAYHRGAAIMHMLRFELGDEVFRNSIRHYVEKHKNGVVESEDLRIAFEEIAQKNLIPFFNQWVYGAGFPEFKVSYLYDKNAGEVVLTVTQMQKELPAVGVFSTPVLIEIVSGSEVLLDTIRITKKEEDFRIPISTKPYDVRFNKNHWILCKVDFEKTFEELSYQLNYDDDVTGRISAAEQLAGYDEKAIDVLRRAVIRDRFYGVRMSAVESLKKIKNDESFEAIMIAADDFDGRVREAALKVLGDFSQKNIKDFLVDKLHTEQNDYVRGAAAFAIGKIKFEDSFEILKNALKYDSHRNIIRRGIFDGFKELGDARALPLVKEYTQYKYSYGGMHLLDISALDCAKTFSNSHRNEVIEVIASALHNPYFRTRNKAAELLAELGAVKKIPEIEKILSEERRLKVRAPMINSLENLKKK
jgi:aminopeptidase N